MRRIDSLYIKVYNTNILKRAWHLAQSDSKTDFVKDTYKNGDFAFYLEENLQSILDALRKEEYHPNPLLHIEVPKSTLAVRPGSKVSIEDKIVLFAITMLIAPRLDKELPEGVYSYRLKEKFDKDSLFRDIELLQFPLLKEKTIRKELVIFEPWYGQYPKFIKESLYAYEQQGFKYLTLSDISAYFENINLDLLHDTLLMYFNRDQKIINLLCSLLRYWTWPTIHGFDLNRGIPQGNEVSSFLGNIYLLPLDIALCKFCKNRDAKYFRYMDDVKIFSKQERVAREAIFVMNDVLRKLHLNIQGSKTTIIKDEEIKKELYDPRLERVNDIIGGIQENKDNLKKQNLKIYVSGLVDEYRAVKGKRNIIYGKELRLYKRLITGFMLLNKSYMVKSILSQIPKNPDSGLIQKVVSYFRFVPRSCKVISDKLISFLQSPINIFPYQEANIISVFRYFNEISPDIINYCKDSLRKKKKDWYVRVQCAYLLSSVYINKRELESLRKFYLTENNVEIRKALIVCLCQLEANKLDKFIQELVNENSRKIYSVGRMLSHLYFNYQNRSLEETDKIFRDYYDDKLIDSFYKIDVIKHCQNQVVRKNLIIKLKQSKRKARKKHLIEKINRAINYLT